VACAALCVVLGVMVVHISGLDEYKLSRRDATLKLLSVMLLSALSLLCLIAIILL